MFPTARANHKYFHNLTRLPSPQKHIPAQIRARGPRITGQRLMPKVSHARKDHGQTMLIGSRNHLIVTH